MSKHTAARSGAPPRQEATDEGQWIPMAEAARTIGVHPAAIKNAALAGSIRYWARPGLKILYNRSDVERLAK